MNIFNKLYEELVVEGHNADYIIFSSNFLNKLKSLKEKMCYAAQKEYDSWNQNEKGEDVELGVGGLCQDIASAICDVLSENGINCSTVSAEIGEQHVWTVAWENESKYNDDGEKIGYNAYNIDIPASIYEIGGGYTWKKIKDVVFSPEDILIDRADDETIDYLMKGF